MTSRTSKGWRGSLGMMPYSSSADIGARRTARRSPAGAGLVAESSCAHDLAGDRQRMAVVVGEVVGDAGGARVHVAAAQVLGGHDLAGGGLHQRRAAQEDGPLVLHDDRLVAHRRHVGAAGRARAHHHRDLRDALRGEVGLVVEDAAEVLLVREDLVLQRQEGAAGIDEVDAGQAVLRARSPARAGASSRSAGSRCRPSPWRRWRRSRTSRPSTRPMPVTMPADGASSPYMP